MTNIQDMAFKKNFQGVLRVFREKQNRWYLPAILLLVHINICLHSRGCLRHARYCLTPHNVYYLCKTHKNMWKLWAFKKIFVDLVNSIFSILIIRFIFLEFLQNTFLNRFLVISFFIYFRGLMQNVKK